MHVHNSYIHEMVEFCLIGLNITIRWFNRRKIEEYRKILNNEQLLLVVEKPLTHVFPELYEDNNNFLLNKKIIPNNNYKIKTNSDNANKNHNSLKKMFSKE